MTFHEFQFLLALSDESYFEAMVSDLVTAVLGHLGFAADAIGEVGSAIRGALRAGPAAGDRRCRLAFEAGRGELRIRIACDGGDEWRTTRPLP